MVVPQIEKAYSAVAVLIEGDIFARGVQIGRQHARVPAAARTVFGHGHAGRDLEEFERFSPRLRFD